MIGPSSSHTAGASRIGYIARQLLGERPKRAVITLYNSFAKTHKGHGTDRAIIGGVIGFAPDDVRLRKSFEIAKKEGLDWDFKFSADLNKYHSNTARIKLIGEKGNNVEVVGVSLGGGRIRIEEVEGFSVAFDAQTPTILIIADDITGSISQITHALAEAKLNIANMFVTRTEHLANMVIEVDQSVPQALIEIIRGFSWVKFVRLVQPLIEGSSRYQK